MRRKAHSRTVQTIVRWFGEAIESDEGGQWKENARFIGILSAVFFRCTHTTPIVVAGAFPRPGEIEAYSLIACPLSSEIRFDALVREVSQSLRSKKISSREDALVAPHVRILVERSSRRSRVLRSVDRWAHPSRATLQKHKWSGILFCFRRTRSSVKLEVTYDPGTHTEGEILALIDCVWQAWHYTAEHPKTTIDNIELVSPAVRRKWFNRFSGRAMRYSKNKTILDLFEDRAIQSPEKTALVFGQTSFTYGQLNGKANALAYELLRVGIKRNDLIPIIFNNSLELPLSMLALLKIGAAFVPLDDGWPADRIDGVLKGLNPKAVLTTSAFPAVFPCCRVSVDALCLATAVEAPRRGVVSFQDLIYGFFTSGSTGVPKCALNCHGGLVNRFLYMTRRFKPHADDVILQNSKQVFDSSIWQLLWPLTFGGKVVIPEPKGLIDLSYTVELISSHRVTMTDFVPSIFNTLVEFLLQNRDQLPKLQSLRQLLIGGEEMNARPVHQFMSCFPNVGITNTYGPTEASIGMIFHEVSFADGDTVPLGRPIDNTYAVVLDERMRLVPPGVVGEIHIGGDCLGKGYLGDQEKTQLAFVTNPFPAIPGDRLYRTGDLGYILPDGKFRFIGRRDQQVKVSGIRVELGEIENILLRHEQIAQAKVLVEDLGANDKRLVAFLVGRGNLDLLSVRSHLQRSLPANILPKRIIVLDNIPLNANGKADRKALHRYLEIDGLPAVKNNSDSGSELEEAMRLLWEQNLKKNPIGLLEDYFAAGGDSLTALRLTWAIQKKLGIKLQVLDVYQNPTIRKLAGVSNTNPERVPAADPPRMADPPWMADLEMPLGIELGSRSRARSRRRVFLTGATGFIGTQLLVDLLEQGVSKVSCLVRGQNLTEARKKLNNSLIAFGFAEKVYDRRIEVVPGDLGLPRLGCSEAEDARLSSEIDEIIHCGAMVDFMHDYNRHRHCNVLGSRAVLELAARVKLKPLIYLSSLSIFSNLEGRSPESRVLEDSPVAGLTAPEGGYNQSKWVAEVLFERGRKLGIPVSIIRLGEVMPHSVKGIPNRKALPFFWMKAVRQLGTYPRSSGRMDYMPVDAASRFILHVLNHRSFESRAYHVFHPKGVPVEEVMAAFAKRERECSQTDYVTFWRMLSASCSGGRPDPDLMSLLLTLPSPLDPNVATDPVSELFLTHLAALDNANANSVWREIGDPPEGVGHVKLDFRRDDLGPLANNRLHQNATILL